MKKPIKTYKAAHLYSKLYGKSAYDAYVRREKEIDALMRETRIVRGKPCKVHPAAEIIALREANFRNMKAGKRRLPSLSAIRLAA